MMRLKIRMEWIALVALLVRGAQTANAQALVYAEVSATKMTNLVRTDFIYGSTFGVTGSIKHLRAIDLGFDVRGSSVNGAVSLSQISVGPQLSVGIKKFKPYTEFLIGFGRLDDGLGTPTSKTTDSEIQVVSGVDRPVTQHISWRVFEFSYEQFYGIGGQYNPKTFSTGAVYRIGEAK